MRPVLLAAAALLAVGCTYVPGKPGAYTDTDVFALGFLKGRWTGVGPDGATFCEQYDFPSAIVLRSQRFDCAFTTPGDSSTVRIEDGEIISRWGEFAWSATDVRPGFIQFSPVVAPGSFSWRKVDNDTVEVVQAWTDEAGKPQSSTMTLKRVR